MREIISLNNEWIFVGNNKQNLKKPKIKPKSFEEVTLPHTLNDYSIDKGVIPQSIMWYRKNFLIDPKHTGKFIAIQFDGIMSECEIFFNGKKVHEHKGGFVPITVDVTKLASFGAPNTLAVKVSNKDNPDILPGVALKKSEYQYFGGIYRGVSLIAQEEVHITATNYGVGVSGGARVYDEALNENLAVVSSRIEVFNASKRTNKVNITANIYDRKGKLLHIFTSPDIQIKARESESIEVTSRVDNPIFWSPDCPYLYDIEFLVSANGGIVDSVRVKHGFRTVKRDHRGFILNGMRLYLRGANRIQQYPYLGMGVSADAEYRDAYKLKKAGFNVVRLIGGGNSQAFLDACDELGLMVISCIPSQQYCSAGAFQDNVVATIRQMARRDRNHTCVVMWEPCLSETGSWQSGASDAFFIECKKTLEEELAYGAPPLIAGDTIGRKDAKTLDYTIPYAEHDDKTMARHMISLPGRKGVVKGYGDYEFGEEKSTTRVDRSDGEKAMLLQAWNYQWSHNRNMSNKDVMGDLIWNNVDYLRPNTPDNPLCKAGIMDMFRLPKFSYMFYQSQRKSPIEHMVFLPTFWDDNTINCLPVYTNCDSVELYINGKSMGEKSVDRGEQEEFTLSMIGKNGSYISQRNNTFWATKSVLSKIKSSKKTALATFMAETMFDSKNSSKIASPPIIYDNITYAPGVIKVEGIVGGSVVCSHVVRTPEAPDKILAKIDYSSKALRQDGEDFVFVYAKVADVNNTTVNTADNMVECKVEGGKVIGVSNTKAVAGIATFVVKADIDAEEVWVNLQSGELTPCRERIVSIEEEQEI